MSDQSQKQDSKEATPINKGKPFQIHRNSIERLDHRHNVWAVEIPEAMSAHELEDPSTWGLAAQKGLRVKDRVEILSLNGSQFSLGLVTYVRGGDIRVQIYAQYNLNEVAQNEIMYQGFKIRYVNNTDQWCIFNGESGERLKGNQPSSQACIKYLDGHFRSLNVG